MHCIVDQYLLKLPTFTPVDRQGMQFFPIVLQEEFSELIDRTQPQISVLELSPSILCIKAVKHTRQNLVSQSAAVRYECYSRISLLEFESIGVSQAFHSH
jgi:hypothetical protein